MGGVRRPGPIARLTCGEWSLSVAPSWSSRHDGAPWQWYETIDVDEEWQPQRSKERPSLYVAEVV